MKETFLKTVMEGAGIGRKKAEYLWQIGVRLPAEQHQGDPVAPYGWHVEWADSGDHYLFTKVEKRIQVLRLDSDVKVVQLYTRADPTEVEQLRDQLEAWQALAAERLERLGERDALLRDTKRSIERNDYPVFELLKRIDATLSASAEPSTQVEMGHVHCTGHVDYAPVEIDERADIRSRLLCADHCKECGHPDCNGQCYGDDMMGDS